MPYFSEPKTVRVELPSSKNFPEGERYYVVMRDRLEVKDVDEIDVEGGKFTGSRTKFAPVISSLITEWNLDDESGEVIPVTPENVARLDLPDFMELTSVAFRTKKISESDEKKSSPAFPPKETEETPE